MKNILKTAILGMAIITTSSFGAKCKMDSDGRTLRNSSGSSIGKIDSDGRTIRNGSNSSIGKVDSDGKTIRNSSNSSILKLDGSDIRNSSNSTIANIRDVTNAIDGAKEEAVYVALWWFLCKD